MRADIHGGQELLKRSTDRPDTLVQDPTPPFRGFSLATHRRSIHMRSESKHHRLRIYLAPLPPLSAPSTILARSQPLPQQEVKRPPPKIGAKTEVEACFA